MHSDNQQVIYCEDGEYRVYCDNLCIGRYCKNHSKSQTHINSTRKGAKLKKSFQII